MFKSINRLKKRKEFGYIYKNGEAKHSGLLTIVFVESKLSFSKIGISVSKKIGKAHIRNLVKRRLRSILYPMIDSLKKSLNIVFVAKPGIETVDFETLKSDVTRLLKRSSLID